MVERLPPPPWFRHEPEKTATGYRWLDLLTAPYWSAKDWFTQRKLWKMLAVNESWRQARDRVQKRWADAMPDGSLE